MSLYALIDANGLNEGVLEMDAPSAAAHPLPRGWQMLPVTAQEYQALKFVGHGARYSTVHGWHLLPDDHVRAWNRAHGGLDHTSVADFEQLYESNRNALRTGGSLACLEKWTGLPLPQIPAPVRARALAPIQVLQDLVIREMTEAEAAALAEEVVATGLYQEPAETTRIRVGTWYRDPDCWPLTVAWREQPIQFETYHFDAGTPQLVRSGFAARLNRDRPYRFWREVFRPYFEQLAALGITTIESRVRADLPDYIDRLVETYDCDRLPTTDPRYVGLRYTITRALAKSTGFAQRRTAGQGWQVVVGNVRTREVPPALIPAVIDRLNTLWGTRARKDFALRLLDERLTLDAATLIVSDVDGQIMDVSASRERRADEASILRVSPYNPDLPGIAERGRLLWHQAVGYRTITAFFPSWMVTNADVAPTFSRIGWQVVRERPDGGEAAIEARVDVEEALARPVDSWA